MPVIPVKYHTGPRSRNGHYVYVFKVVGAGAEAWNKNCGVSTSYGTGPNPVKLRFFASQGLTFYRYDCVRDGRDFSQKQGVRTMVLCLPLPVKFGDADYHLTVVWVREHRRAIIIHWMLGTGFSLEVAECIAECLVGRKLTSLNYSAWLRFN